MSENRPPQSPLTLQAMLFGHALTQVLVSLHQSGISAQLAQQPQDTETLARNTGLEVSALQQFLLVTEQAGFIQQDATQHYRLTDTGQCLLPDHATTMIPLLEHAALSYPAWARLTHSLRTGKAAFPEAYGADIYDYFATHPADNEAFRRYMAHTTQAWLAPAVSCYPFSGHVIDLGGSQGDFSALLLQHYPELRSTVFDLPETVASASEVLAAAGVTERSHIQAGSFFEPTQIPTDGTHYLFSRVLLNWSDDQVVQILRNCRQAMPASSKLVILDCVQIPQADLAAEMGNLNLLVMFGAKVRTQSLFEDLIQQAGFNTPQWIPASKVMDKLPLYYLEARL